MKCLKLLKKSTMGLLSMAPLALGLSMGVSGTAQAGAGVTQAVQSCTGINCVSQLISGVVPLQEGNIALPYTTQVYALAGECLRLDTTVQQGDLEMVVVGPAGHVYRNDDRGGAGAAGLRPLIKIDPVPTSGWYAVSLSTFNGVGVSNGGSTFRYGRYNTGNPNCATPTLELTTTP